MYFLLPSLATYLLTDAHDSKPDGDTIAAAGERHSMCCDSVKILSP
jgi:hypothetical protein